MKQIAISMGDALGIGPEVVALALDDPRVRAQVSAVVYGQREVLERAARMRGVSFQAEVVEVALPRGEDSAASGGRPAVGRSDAAGAGALALACVDAAARAALSGAVQAICTAPLSKERVALTAKGFAGHTEFLAGLANAKVAMMLAGPRLRVVLATNHLALKEVPKAISTAQIAFVAELAATSLHDRFGIARPRIAILGLNPHAGDGGIFGDEEARIVAPAVRQLRERGVEASGPWPADGLFPRAVRGDFDAVVALYHDQGLIAAKLLDFRETVNVTLGLPFVRTSPDHGTADDIAWQGKADPEPMATALLLAARLAG
ncbi:MAG TPA: 4-hydroxythreonine-4-phosphate dehydrogenase PdxA [Myxococcales bacterium]